MPVAGPIRILLADDHVSQRSVVRAILESEGGFEICAEAATADEAVELAQAMKPDLCLLDVRMPGSGISAAARIATLVPETFVVMLSVSDESEDLFDALRAGAVGYLLKDTSADRLPEALRGALRGEAAMPRPLVSALIDEFQQRGRRRAASGHHMRSARLTTREWEVLDLMCEGLGTEDIARRLFVGAVTVRSHVSSILKKLKVDDRESAVQLFRSA
jgi:DNA-binding NarL/FixJ family response regulator